MKVKNNLEWNKIFITNFTGIVEICDGIKTPYRFGIFHRKNGSYHNENGPAAVWEGRGNKSLRIEEWFLNGQQFNPKFKNHPKLSCFIEKTRQWFSGLGGYPRSTIFRD
jgi:hypothetical protein